jgi:hypothetical protein
MADQNPMGGDPIVGTDPTTALAESARSAIGAARGTARPSADRRLSHDECSAGSHEAKSRSRRPRDGRPASAPLGRGPSRRAAPLPLRPRGERLGALGQAGRLDPTRSCRLLTEPSAGLCAASRRAAEAARKRATPVALMTTAEVATDITMSEDWVRDHAGELGAIRAGRTERAPLRFEPERIEAWKRLQRISQPVANGARRRRADRPPAGLELLPLPTAAAGRSRR